MTKVTPKPYYECDCCGARIKQEYEVRHIRLDMIRYSIDWDLCEKCANHIEGHIKGRKEAAQLCR